MKKILAGMIMAVLVSFGTAFAQEISFGDPAVQTVQIRIAENGDVHVTHLVDKSKTTAHLEFLSNDYANLTVTDEEGGSPQYAQASAEKVGIVIFPSSEDVVVEYDVAGFITERNGFWTLDYQYLADTAFYLPENVKLFYVNNSIVDLGEREGFLCHGCQAMLEYELVPTQITKQVQWEDKKFDVTIITQTKISSLALDQENKRISFDVTEPNKYVTLIIPRALLWNPYEVFLDEKLILEQERIVGDDVWLHIKPKDKGTVEIVGVSVVPEFPLATILVLTVAMSVVIYAKRASLR